MPNNGNPPPPSSGQSPAKKQKTGPSQVNGVVTPLNATTIPPTTPANTGTPPATNPSGTPPPATGTPTASSSSAVTPCPTGSSTPYNQTYLNAVTPLVTQNNTTGTAVKAKRANSEKIGEEAVIAVNSALRNQQETRADYQIFDGRDVFDLVRIDPVTKDVEIKEAKGGKSQFGTRQGPNNQPLQQCTRPYAEDIANKMANSSYKGVHSRVACATHASGTPPPGPQRKCKDCAMAERKRRKDVGDAINDALANNKLVKVAARGDYNDKGPKNPQKITHWQSNSAGGVTPL